MSCRILLRCGGYLLTGLTAACGTPDTQRGSAAEQATKRRADPSGNATSLGYMGLPDTTTLRADTVSRIVCYFPPQCYWIAFPDSALQRPLALHRGFTGKLFVAVNVDTARRQLSDFRLFIARLYRRTEPDRLVALNFNSGQPVPDSLARLLPQLEQHIRNLRPKVVVISKDQLESERNICEMPAEWIFPVRIR